MFFGKWKIAQEREIGKLKEFQRKNIKFLERITEQIDHLRHLEKNHANMKDQIRGAQTARKELATRIMRLEARKKEKKRRQN